MFASAWNMFRENKFTWNTFLINMFVHIINLFVSNTFHPFLHDVCIFTAPVCLKLFARSFWEKLSQRFCFRSMANIWWWISSSVLYLYQKFCFLVVPVKVISTSLLTPLVWSWSKLPREAVSIMIRLNKFWSCSTQCTTYVVWTSFTVKHVSFVFRLNMFRAHVNTA